MGRTGLSQIEAAVEILKDCKEKCLSAGELVDRSAMQKLWVSSNGKTPAATLSAAIGRDISQAGAESRFCKPAPGRFALTKVGRA